MMAERINTPMTNEHFAAFCLSMLGQPYWYGCVMYKCTESLRARKAKQYPDHYGSSRTSRYKMTRQEEGLRDVRRGLQGLRLDWRGSASWNPLGT